ncbi:MAG: hypothetical protein J6Y07_02450 [Alphaproteobacteria bacterium]|nr:hypothetical protein [Alphaproteobacteria bacterium]
MKRLISVLITCVCATSAVAASRPSTSVRAARSVVPGVQPSDSSQQKVVKRSSSSSNASSTTSSGTTSSGATVSAGRSAVRAAVSARTAGGRSATPPVNPGRAAKQNVIGSGTKVATAKQNTTVDPVCWEKFGGCMDSFCMLDNASGGRCICSDKNAEYDAILAEIQKLDDQSYQLATVGVEKLEMGEDAEMIMSKANAVADSVISSNTKSKRQALDLTSWNSLADTEDDDDFTNIFSLSSDDSSIENKTGDALYRASVKLCNAQIPECESQYSMMELMYKQNIRADCTAYENSLRQQRTQSAQKLYAAQSAMREAALEQYKTANKYDLGQCTIQFKQCMQTTGGCGEDFSGCVDLAARANAMAGFAADSTTKQKTIKGTISDITITAETYDTLNAKRELCMYVTKECVNVRDQVFDAFLREAAPQIKSAELSVESNMRTSCISEISNCFQKACKDTMDPNDPEGSYDMCLTRPDTLRSVCKVQIDPCEKAEPKIMDYVRARLKSMRVDSCTNEFKLCLQSDDRCGKDYANCIGLSTDAIIDMCPMDKLTGCTYEKSSKGDTSTQNIRSTAQIREELLSIAQGIFLNIDNNLLATCQKTLRTKLLEVCGSVSQCEAFDDDNLIGKDSLIQFRDGDKIIIDGLMNMGLLEFDNDITVKELKFTNASKNQSIGKESSAEGEADLKTIDRIKGAIGSIEKAIQRKVDVLLTDPTLDMCVNGRDTKWKGTTDKTGGAGIDDKTKYGRFPRLLDSAARMIMGSALDKAYINYNEKFDELVTKAVEEQDDDIKTALCSAIGYKPECTKWDSYRCAKYAQNGLTSVFKKLSETDIVGLKNGGTQYVVHVADLASKMKAMSNGIGEFVLTDKDGNMLGSITTQAIYSPTTNICTVKTTSMMCSDMEAIIVETERDECGNGGIISAGCNGFSLIGGTSRTKSVHEYMGNMCSKYGEPKEETTEIKM